MINIEEICNKYGIIIKKIKNINNYIIIKSIDKMYLIKTKDSPKKELFDYLSSINYHYYLPIINSYTDYYEIYPYYEDKSRDYNMKGKEIVKALTELHTKTIFYDEINKDDYKALYEMILEQIQSLYDYYINLQDFIDTFSFPRMDYYYLIKNISKVYKSLEYAREKINSWFQKEKLRMRKCLVLHNAYCDNFRVNDTSYFIDFKNSKNDYLIYDFVSFYRKDYYKLDMVSLFREYNSKIKLSEDEVDLFNCLISIPLKVSFQSSVYQNTLSVKNMIDYIDYTFQFISEENKKDQKTNEKEFKE